MLQPMVSLSSGRDAGVIDSARSDANSGVTADARADHSSFDRLVRDYQSADKQIPAMKELAAGVKDASSKSGESSPLLPAADAESDPLDNINDDEGLMSYLMANSGAVADSGASDALGNQALAGAAMAETLDTETGLQLQAANLELATVSGEGESLDTIGLDGELANGQGLTQQGGLLEGVNAKGSEAAVSQSRLSGEKTTAEQVLNSTSISTDAAKQNLATAQTTQALSEDAVLEQNQQVLSQQGLKDSAKQVDINQSQMLAQQGADADELLDAGLEKNLRTPADMLHSSNVQAKNQPSLDLQNIQQGDNFNRPMRLANAATALSERIQTMISSNTQNATVRLDPPELGSMEIRIQVKNDQTHVQIITSSAQTREALEQQSVRLREALVDQGLNLSNLDVSDQQTQERSGNGESGSGQRGGGLLGEGEPLDEPESIVSTTLGFIDQYV